MHSCEILKKEPKVSITYTYVHTDTVLSWARTHPRTIAHPPILTIFEGLHVTTCHAKFCARFKIKIDLLSSHVIKKLLLISVYT